MSLGLQVPSNIILLRVGWPRWLGFLVFGWGCVATCAALMTNLASFYVLRLLLGVFEAGAAPAIWYAIAQCYPQERCVHRCNLTTGQILIADSELLCG